MKFIKYFFVTVLAISAVSCTKVIDIDLNEDDQKIVVEGFVIEGDTTQRVHITKTLNFDQSVAYPVVDDAVVTVVDNLGNTGTFTSVGNGWYELTSYPGVPGRTYYLTVVTGGKTYSASSKMPDVLLMDNLDVTLFPFGVDTFINVTPVRLDQAGISNYYSFDIIINDTLQKGIYLQDDQFADGNYILQPLFGPNFKKLDTVTIRMANIDRPVYDYFNQLATNTNGQGATPANPVSNFSGGCLGYFSARSTDVKTVIIPE
jgi:Domain of unknown function (DUF4249)